MLATSALHLSGHRRRQIACRRNFFRCRKRWKSLGVKSGLYGGVVHLSPPKWGDEVLSLSSRVRPSVIVKQKNGGTQQSAPFVLNCTPQLLQRFTTNSRVYYCALGQKFYQENSLSVPEYGAHDLPCWNSLLELLPFRRASMLPVQGLLFWFSCDMGHPCLISCHNMAQQPVSFLMIAHQKCQSCFLCSSMSILGTHRAHTFR